MPINIGGDDGLPLQQRIRAENPRVAITDPLTLKGEFRLGIYTIEEEKDDYLICRGFDPNAKHPSSDITPNAPRMIKVAKPALLLRSIWDGQTVDLIVDGNPTPVTFEYTGIGVRIARATLVNPTTGEEEEVEEVQRITMDYIVGDQIIAVEVRRNSAIDGLDVDTESGGRLSWVDLNMSGRCWAVSDEEP